MNATTVATPPAIRLRIAGMDCGSCAMTIETAMRGLPGVETVRVDFTTETLEARGAVSRDVIESRLHELGYRVASEQPSVKPQLQQDARGLGGFLRFLASNRRTQIAAAAALLIAAVGVASLAVPAAAVALRWILIATVVGIGAPFVVKGFRALFFARRVTIDLLMGVAAVGALAIGEAGEAAAVVLLFTLGEALEAYSAERSRSALKSLMALQPDEATVLEPHAESHAAADDHAAHDGHSCSDDDHGHGHGHDHDHDHRQHGQHARPAAVHYHQVRRATGSIAPGTMLLVKPGERIPLDSRVLEGNSGVNQAAVTGESMPVEKSVGDEVLAGTVNGTGALTLETLRPAGDSTVSRIARLVERALSERTPAERFIDRFSQWYTPLVVAIAALIVAIPVLMFGQPLLESADGTHGWLYRGLALLIIACPCALIISIPVTVVSALTRLAQLGVLVKGGERLDRLADVRVIAFDKTGTLTIGKPAVTAVRGRDCGHEETNEAECQTCDEVVAVAAAVERASEHPLAQAVVDAARHKGIGHVAAAADVTAHAGKGVTGIVGRERVTVGSHELLEHGPQCGDELCASATDAQSSGRTVMVVGRNGGALGYIGVEDQPRPESSRVLADLHAIDPALRTVMLTGDNEAVAAGIARRIGGVDQVKANLRPADKLAAIRALQAEGHAVAMIGDGINDAPALAQADVGFAMGAGGTAQAMETADVVLIEDDLERIPAALRISRQTRAVIKQNIALSLGLKLAVLALAIPGLASLWLAVLADVGATLIVTLNGMRLLRAS